MLWVSILKFKLYLLGNAIFYLDFQQVGTGRFQACLLFITTTTPLNILQGVPKKDRLKENTIPFDHMAMQRSEWGYWWFTQVKTNWEHVLDTWLLHRCAQHPKIPFILTSKTTLSQNYAIVLKPICFWDTLYIHILTCFLCHVAIFVDCMVSL